MDKKYRFINGHNFFFWNFRETTHHFSLRSQNSEFPRIFQVTGANQKARKLLSNDLVNTKNNVLFIIWSATLQSPDKSKGWAPTRLLRWNLGHRWVESQRKIQGFLRSILAKYEHEGGRQASCTASCTNYTGYNQQNSVISYIPCTTYLWASLWKE